MWGALKGLILMQAYQEEPWEGEGSREGRCQRAQKAAHRWFGGWQKRGALAKKALLWQVSSMFPEWMQAPSIFNRASYKIIIDFQIGIGESYLLRLLQAFTQGLGLHLSKVVFGHFREMTWGQIVYEVLAAAVGEQLTARGWEKWSSRRMKLTASRKRRSGQSVLSI